MSRIAAAVIMVLYAVGLVTTAGGAYGAMVLVIDGGPIMSDRFFLAVCGSLMLVGASALADWLTPPAKPEESPEGMLR